MPILGLTRAQIRAPRSVRRTHVIRALGCRRLAAFLLTTASLLWGQSAQAAVFNVNSTSDAPDAVPGDGACASTAPSAPCTLRAALEEANALSGADTVVLASGTYTLTVTGGDEDEAFTGDLDVLEDVTIKGQGPAATVIDGNAMDRVFDCAPQSVLTSATPVSAVFSRLSIRNGSAGGGGGAIRYACDLHLFEVELYNNSGLAGGALYADSGSIFDPVEPTLEVVHSYFHDNHAFSAGAIDLTHAHSAHVRESRFLGNVANTFGGAIDAYQAVTSIVDSHFESNGATSSGAMMGSALTISGSTFVDNYSTGNNAVVTVSGPSLITNSTFTRNSGGLGGAVATNNALTVNNSTFVDNWAFKTGESYRGGALNPFGSSASVTLSNTVMQGNSPSCPRALTSLGYNLSDDDTCGLTATGDFQDHSTGVDPSLHDNGGPTWTHALLPGSFAIDRGNPASVGAGLCEARDQRQISRPIRGDPGSFGVLCDIGAYERCPDGTTGSDYDHDGLPDKCDSDDDDDGCFDAHDAFPKRSMARGGPLVGTCGRDTWYYHEGLDSDGDGLLNCEDNDDDDDGAEDETDICPIDASPLACVRPGLLCPLRWFRCWGSSCYEWILKFVSIVNPGPEYFRVDRFERVNDALYLLPTQEMSAAQMIQRIAGGNEKSALSRGPLEMRGPSQAAAYRVEVWKRATKDAKEERIGVLAEFDRSKIKVGSLVSGSFARLDLPQAKGGALRLATTWAIGLEAGERLPDADGDSIPTTFDNCAWTANREQLDKNGSGIGEACEPVTIQSGSK